MDDSECVDAISVAVDSLDSNILSTERAPTENLVKDFFCCLECPS